MSLICGRDEKRMLVDNRIGLVYRTLQQVQVEVWLGGEARWVEFWVRTDKGGVDWVWGWVRIKAGVRLVLVEGSNGFLGFARRDEGDKRVRLGLVEEAVRVSRKPEVVWGFSEEGVGLAGGVGLGERGFDGWTRVWMGGGGFECGGGCSQGTEKGRMGSVGGVVLGSTGVGGYCKGREKEVGWV